MNLRIVPFEEIEKNKWNGTVHYAKNGNVFGYHWYLKSIIREWDAIVEGDYQSVMPVPRTPLTPFEQKIFGISGPYTVNDYSKSRFDAFYKLWEDHRTTNYHPFHTSWSEHIINQDNKLFENKSWTIKLSDSYDQVFETYSPDIKSFLNDPILQFIEISVINKPETYLEDDKLNEKEKSVLYRIFYNAMHRGVGFGIQVKNIKTKETLNSFFLNMNQDIFHFYCSENASKDLLQILIDQMIKNNSSKNVTLNFSQEMRDIPNSFGAQSTSYFISEQEKPGFYTSILKHFKS